MKKRKIRGHKRRWSDIENWIENNKYLDIDYLKDYKRDYAKIRVHPWSSISPTNSIIPEPKKETKRKIVNGLIEIYDSWKLALDKLGEPYYLKLWIFDQRFSNSQVVCAIEEEIDFYKDTFYKPDSPKTFKYNNYGTLEKVMQEFEWDYRIDEDHFDDSEPGDPEFYASMRDYQEAIRYYTKMLKSRIEQQNMMSL